MQTLSGLWAQFTTLFQNSLLVRIVVVLVILFIVLLITIPLIRKAKKKSIKAKETKEMMKDLMVWKHLSQLVKGGEDEAKAKQLLSNNLLRINSLIKDGITLTLDDGRGLYDVPWYVLLGEPESGKSSLVEESDLEFVPSANEQQNQADANSEKKNFPVRFWVGAKAIVCDISGRTFFDRWVSGSSAEWRHIIKQICRLHSRKPLDGVILTIPADALIADDDSMTHKKAILIANEFSTLLHISGMHLPCHVVVTKLDMVNGFREYARGIIGDLRHQILGYTNEGQYDTEKFRIFWDALLERLRLGCRKRMLSGDIATNVMVISNRIEAAGKIYLFPENFSALFNNLDIYLKVLFGENNFLSSKNMYLSGVYFTSARDINISLSPSLTALTGKTVDELVLPGKTGEWQTIPRGYFIRDMLHKKVFAPSAKTYFIRKEIIRRHIPRYILCAAAISIGITWLSAVFFNTTRLRGSLLQITSYYNTLDSALRKGTPFVSSLITENETASYRLSDEPLQGETISSRVQFFFNALNYRDVVLNPPLGYRLAELFTFGPELNMGKRDRGYIANQLHSVMVRTPVIKAVGKKLANDSQKKVTLDQTLSSAIESFLLLDALRGVEIGELVLSDKFDLEPMIEYLMPDISNDTMNLLMSYQKRYERRYSFSMDMNYIYSNDYFNAEIAALNLMLGSWRRQDVYPDSMYGKIKSLVKISEDIVDNYSRINAVFARINNARQTIPFNYLQETVHEWKGLTERQAKLINQGRTLFYEIEKNIGALNIPVVFAGMRSGIGQNGGQSNGGQSIDAFGNNLINEYLLNDLAINFAVDEFTNLFKRDMSFIEGKSNLTGEGDILGQIIALRNEFSSNLNREVTALQERALVLKNTALLAEKIDAKSDAASLFTVVENIINLASAVNIVSADDVVDGDFNAAWNLDQYSIDIALDNYENYVKPFAENEKLSSLVQSGRNMIFAQSYVNRYIIFTSTLAFLSTSEANIRSMVEQRSLARDSGSIFTFSSGALEGAVGGLHYNRGYDPVVAKEIADAVYSFTNIFNQNIKAEEMPAFLRNKDAEIHEPPAFRNYLASYIRYWGSYPDNSYIPANSWSAFKSRAAGARPYQINSVLQSLYTQCIGFLNGINNGLLSGALVAEKNRAIASLDDDINLLNTFMSADAEKMLLAWTELPSDTEEAVKILRGRSEQELKDSYLILYSGTKDIRIGWWDSFSLNGIEILSGQFKSKRIAEFSNALNSYRAFPLIADGSAWNSLSYFTIESMVPLFEDMGVLVNAEDGDTIVKTSLHPNLFRGSAAQRWAQTIYSIAKGLSDTRAPLAWTLRQAPTNIQRQFHIEGYSPAIDRFRYVEIVSLGKTNQRHVTYTREPVVLAQGNASDASLDFRFYRTSMDLIPQAEYMINTPWAILSLYLNKQQVTDNEGKVYYPVFIEDEAGKYVYFAEIELNREFTGADNWYTESMWPKLRVNGGIVTAE
jgi:competence protein ComGC